MSLSEIHVITVIEWKQSQKQSLTVQDYDNYGTKECYIKINEL